MTAHILGTTATQPHCELPESYFRERDCWVDCRWPDLLWIAKDANLGWCVTLVCGSHNVDPGMFGDVTKRRITIKSKAFVAGFTTLYNCVIGEGAVVAVGTVVRNRVVPDWTMVEGNPVRIIKRFDKASNKWIKVPPEDCPPVTPP